jgi:chromosome segregation ATPase
VLWLGFAIAITGAIVLLRRRGERAAPPLPVKDMRILRDFTDVSNEISVLRTELKSLEEKYDQKRIRKKLYKRRRRTLQQQLHNSSRELQNLKKEVVTLDPRLKDAVYQIEVAEAELETMHSNVQKIKAQYHSGRISRKAYEDLREEYEKRSNDAQRSIDEAIMRLRSELR